MILFSSTKIIVVSKISVSCFSLNQNSSQQLALIDLGEEKTNRISGALDKINDRFGEFTITPAIMMDMKDTVVDRSLSANHITILDLLWFYELSLVYVPVAYRL